MTDEFDPFAEDYDTSAAETAEDAGSGGGGGIEIAGRYHVVIKTVKYQPAEIEGDKDDDDKKRKLPRVEMTMEVQAGEHEAEVGKKLYHTIYLATWEDRDAGEVKPMSEKKIAGVLYFLYVFGTVDDSVFGQEKVKISLDMFERLDGTHAVVQVDISEERTDEKTGKTYKPRAQISWDNNCWRCDHEKVADVPKHPALAGAAAAMAAADDDLDDI